jgi:hypothetical protein
MIWRIVIRMMAAAGLKAEVEGWVSSGSLRNYGDWWRKGIFHVLLQSTGAAGVELEAVREVPGVVWTAMAASTVGGRKTGHTLHSLKVEEYI